MGLNAKTFEAPEHWACALINGDFSGMTENEIGHMHCYLENELPADYAIVSCADESRFTWSYRLYGGEANGGHVLQYTYLTNEA